mgnify:CR=1 FL=1
MNFFQHQDRARRQSRTLIVAFVLAILAIVAAIDALLLVVVGASSMEEGAPLPAPGALFEANLPLLAGGALVTLAVIGVASLFKIATLRSGGGQVARQLGGVLVESDTQDHQRRQLRNVVEEISLASGVPVPEIYVLEQEAGINAFAAGYTSSDAAVAVTRGALEKLSRNELQGVIAHEFSHILNGDMRLNIRLMGVLFGILVLGLMGRMILRGGYHGRLVTSRRGKGAPVVLLIGLGLAILGWVGVFFARLIKAGQMDEALSVARQQVEGGADGSRGERGRRCAAASWSGDRHRRGRRRSRRCSPLRLEPSCRSRPCPSPPRRSRPDPSTKKGAPLPAPPFAVLWWSVRVVRCVRREGRRLAGRRPLRNRCRPYSASAGRAPSTESDTVVNRLSRLSPIALSAVIAA